MLPRSTFVIDDDFTVFVKEEPEEESDVLSTIEGNTRESPEAEKTKEIDTKTEDKLQINVETNFQTHNESMVGILENFKGSVFQNLIEEPYVCPLCSMQFLTRETILAHVDQHLVLERYEERNNAQTETIEILKQFQKSVAQHTVKKPYVCPNCSYETTTNRVMIRHVDRHLNQEKSHKCKNCQFSTFSKSSFSRHQAKCEFYAHKVFCPHCSFVTAKRKNLRSHIGSMHTSARIFSCRRCEFKGLKDELGKHMVEVHPKRDYDCAKCDFRTSMKRKLERHKTVHEKKEKVLKQTIFKCDLCDYESDYKANVLRHRGNIHMQM